MGEAQRAGVPEAYLGVPIPPSTEGPPASRRQETCVMEKGPLKGETEHRDSFELCPSLFSHSPPLPFWSHLYTRSTPLYDFMRQETLNN